MKNLFQDIKKIGAVKIVKNRKYISSCRLIPKKSGSIRLAIDLRFLNKFIQ